MDSSTIYLVGADGALLPMTQHAYDSESLLQRLVATHPALLGVGVGSGRWLLVQREMPVPDEQAGAGRWSLDHLFVDERAVPTLVEVKRATDTRIRREVIGQLLDYAANGLEYWPSGELRRALEATVGSADAAEAAVEELTGGMDPDEFWQLVDANLRRGRLRLVILADSIPRELQRIIEFLNERMPDTEVLAMEVQQFLGGGQQTLVPRIVGNTTVAQRVKATHTSADFATLLAESSVPARQLHDRLLTWVQLHGGTAVPAAKSISFKLSGRQVVRFYPMDGVLELGLIEMRKLGLEAEADQMHAELRALFPGRNLTKQYPTLPAEGLLEHWDVFIGDVLPRFMAHVGFPPTPTSRP